MFVFYNEIYLFKCFYLEKYLAINMLLINWLYEILLNYTYLHSYQFNDYKYGLIVDKHFITRKFIQF